MNIIIPMAGMGKRMRPHTLTTAKPLIPIAGKPIVQRLVEDIIATSNEKVEEIAFIIGPSFGKEVEDHLCKVAESLGAKAKICYQHEPKGTAHAILCAEESLKGNVFIAFADTPVSYTHLDVYKRQGMYGNALFKSLYKIYFFTKYIAKAIVLAK